MGSIIKFYLLILIVTSIHIGKAEFDSNAFHGVPSYTLLTYSSPVVNEGDKVSIDLFISGVGDVDANKFRISIPPYILKGKSIEITEFKLNQDKNRPIFPPETMNLQAQSGKTLSENYFKYYNISNFPALGNYGEFQIERNGKEYAPITITFTVNDTAPPGDHTISMILFYKNGSQWYMNEKNVPVHVRYWYEKSWFYFLAIVAIIPIIYELTKKSYELIKNIYAFFRKLYATYISKRTRF